MTTSLTSDPETCIYELLNIGENEEIEFKHAKGGFPKELWPTYSAEPRGCGETEDDLLVFSPKSRDY